MREREREENQDEDKERQRKSEMRTIENPIMLLHNKIARNVFGATPAPSNW